MPNTKKDEMIEKYALLLNEAREKEIQLIEDCKEWKKRSETYKGFFEKANESEELITE